MYAVIMMAFLCHTCTCSNARIDQIVLIWLFTEALFNCTPHCYEVKDVKKITFTIL